MKMKGNETEETYQVRILPVELAVNVNDGN